MAAEDSAANLRELLDKAAAASSAAKEAVEQNTKRVKEALSARTKNLSRLEGARMQERLSAALRAAADNGDASLADVRERIEARYTRAVGAAAPAAGDPAALEAQRKLVNDRARNRMTRIRSDIGLSDLPRSASLCLRRRNRGRSPRACLCSSLAPPTGPRPGLRALRPNPTRTSASFDSSLQRRLPQGVGARWRG